MYCAYQNAYLIVFVFYFYFYTFRVSLRRLESVSWQRPSDPFLLAPSVGRQCAYLKTALKAGQENVICEGIKSV